MDVNGLSEEVKAKLRECKSAEELRALAEEEGIELTDELLEGVSGGESWPRCGIDDSPCGGLQPICGIYGSDSAKNFDSAKN